MRNKIKLTTIFLTILLTLTIPLSVTTASATTFELQIPAFGLYCKNQTAEIHGNVKYIIDENAQAVQYSKYTINAEDENVTLYIPFISNAFDIPQIDINIEGEICYGEPYSIFTDKLNYDFYTTDFEDIEGTIYTVTPSSENLTIEFTMLENQIYIYRLPHNRIVSHGGNNVKYTTTNATPDIPYELFLINGDCSNFSSNAEMTKETVTVKEYIARYLKEFEDYFEPLGTAEPDILYAITKQALTKSTNYEFFDFFLDSYTQQRLNAYKIYVQPSCSIEYSMPVDVQKNSSFTPEIFMTEVTTTGDYSIDYTIELNSSNPYIIESSADVKKQTDNIYTVENVNGDFYFVFSASEKPQSIYTDNNKMETWRIVLFALSGVFGCGLIVCITMLIYNSIRNKKAQR